MNSKTHFPQNPSPFRLYFTVTLNTLLMFGFFIWLAHTRNVDGDEGLYLEAARLVFEGKKLYLDFFYQQMPLIPYLYAGWMKIFGFTLYAGRYLSALLTALACWAALFYIARASKNLGVLYVSAILLFANGVLLAWAPVIKTHPLNMFTLTLSAVLLLEWRKNLKKPFWMIAVAAFAIGIGVNARLTLAPFVPIYLGFVYFYSPQKIKHSLLFLSIILLTSLPTLYYFFSDPQLFIRFNFTYHTHIFPGIASAETRLAIATWIFARLHFFILIALVQLGILYSISSPFDSPSTSSGSLRAGSFTLHSFLKSDEGFISLLLLVFIAVHLSTAEPFTQYFSAMVPLMVMATLPFLEKMLVPLTSLKLKFLIPALILYLFTSTAQKGFEIYSVGSDDPFWKLSNIESTIRAVQKIVKPGDYCLTWWPGYAFMAGCQSVPGMENHMRTHAIDVGIPGHTLQEYKMMSDEKLSELLQENKYDILIDGAYHLKGPLTPQIEFMIWKNYHLIQKIEEVKIYRKQEARGDIF